tara:strand:+ start:30463 stop:31314 length:852 start_codon:yes stop_codon:yes gene_type:complete
MKTVSLPKLKAFRENMDWSQDMLSEYSGVSVRTIQRIESGGNTSIESARALSASLELSDYTVMQNEIKDALPSTKESDDDERKQNKGDEVALTKEEISLVRSLIKTVVTLGWIVLLAMSLRIITDPEFWPFAKIGSFVFLGILILATFFSLWSKTRIGDWKNTFKLVFTPLMAINIVVSFMVMFTPYFFTGAKSLQLAAEYSKALNVAHEVNFILELKGSDESEVVVNALRDEQHAREIFLSVVSQVNNNSEIKECAGDIKENASVGDFHLWMTNATNCSDAL